MTDKKLIDKIAVVTGGARGIGGEIAVAFAQAGADVVVADLLEESASGACPVGYQAGWAKVAIRPHRRIRREAGADMVTATHAEFGRIDILVNNAGTFSQVNFDELEVAEWDRVISVNLRGVFLGCRFVLPEMLQRGSGKIINVASQLGQIGGVEMVHYSASKAGVIGLTKALAREVSARGVHVNAIAPGPILTDMMAEETEEWATRKLAELPMARFGQPQEVAPSAVFLASDDSSYFVGQTRAPTAGTSCSRRDSPCLNLKDASHW
jgi:3-oxoacyl-[acyl-carrier protein] reductase